MLQDLLSLAIFGSFLWFAVTTIILLALFFYSEHEEQGFIAFSALVAYVLLNYYKGNVPLLGLLTWVNAGVYFGIGFLYAILRTFVYGRKIDIVDSFYLKKLKGNVFRWWFLWPISLIYWIVSDLISDIYEVIYDKIGHGFEYILKAGFNSKKKD